MRIYVCAEHDLTYYLYLLYLGNRLVSGMSRMTMAVVWICGSGIPLRQASQARIESDEACSCSQLIYHIITKTGPDLCQRF